MGQQAPSKAYHRIKHTVFFLSILLDFALLLIFFHSGASLALKDAVSRWTSQPFLINASYLCFLGMGFYFIHLPIRYYSQFLLEHRFKLSNQSAADWLRDDGKAALLGFGLSLLLVQMIYFLLGRFPDHWWVAAGFFWLLVSFVLAKITPSIIVPMFYKYQDVGKPELKKRIFALFERCGTRLKDVYAIDFSRKTKKANAFLCGVGRSRRVVLSDTLLSQFNDDEIELVVAHELGHYKHGDIMKMLLLSGAVTFAGFYAFHEFFRGAVDAYRLSGMDDISFLPIALVAFMVFSLMTTPLLNGVSRMIEREADRFSIETTGKPKDFISMMRKLGQLNLADFEPAAFIEWFLYDHPPIAKRIAFAESFHYDG